MSHPSASRDRDHNDTKLQQQHNKRVAGALLRTSPRFVSSQGGPPKKRHRLNRDRDNPPERVESDSDAGRRVTRSRAARANRNRGSREGENRHPESEGRDCGDTRMAEAVPREGSPRCAETAAGTGGDSAEPIPVASQPVPRRVQAPVIVGVRREQPSARASAPPSAAELARRAERRAAWPLQGILEPGENDCLFGRGGGTNHHPGNKRYRQMVEGRKARYMASKRLDKPLVAMEIINEWRALDPPGRFLKQDEHTKCWNDVGDKKAREKTSQALREKQIVAAAETAAAPPPPPPQRQARFEPGTTSPVSRHNKRPVMARNHSLGTTEPGVDVSLAGFSWDEGDDQPPPPADSSARAGAQPQFQGEYRGGGGYAKPPPLPPPPPPSSYRYPEDGQQQQRPPYYDPYYGPHYHYHHHPPPHTPGGHGGHPPPPSPYAYHPHYSPSHAQHRQPAHYGPRPPQFRRDREHSLQSNPLKGATTAQSQKPDTFREGGDKGAARAGSYGDAAGGPGPGSAAPGYGESNPHYYSHPPPPHGYYPPPPAVGGYPPPPHGPPPYQPPRGGSGSAFGPYAERQPDESAQRMYDRRDGGSSSSAHSMVERQRSLATSAAARASVGSSTDYSRIADLIVRDSSEKTAASTTTRGGSWDERGASDEAVASSVVPRSNSMPPLETNLKESFVPPRPTSGGAAVEVEKPSLMKKISGGALHRPNGQLKPPSDGVCRPEPVKRETSNQPESLETKRSVKRVVLSRDKSQVSKNLKEQQQASGESSAQPSLKLTKAEMLDRRLSVEINRLGIGGGDAGGDGEGNVGALPLDRITTEDMVEEFIQNGDLEGIEDDPVLLAPAPGPAGRISTMDKFAMEVLDGKPPSDWDESLNLVDSDEAGAVAADVDSETASKWLKSGSM